MLVIGITVAVPGIPTALYYVLRNFFNFSKYNSKCFFIIPKIHQTTVIPYIFEIMMSLHNPLSTLMMLYSMKSQINEIIKRHWKRFKKIPIYNNGISIVGVSYIRENRNVQKKIIKYS